MEVMSREPLRLRLRPALLAAAAIVVGFVAGIVAMLLTALLLTWHDGALHVTELRLAARAPYVAGLVAEILIFLLLARRMSRTGPSLPLRAATDSSRLAAMAALGGALFGLVLVALQSWGLPAIHDDFGPYMTIGSTLETLARLLLVVPAIVVAEEWMFRGVLQPRLARVLPDRAAIVVTAGAFSLCHADGLTHVATTFVLGLVAGELALRCGSLWPSIWFHLGYDEAFELSWWAQSLHGVPALAIAAVVALVLAVVHAGARRATPPPRAEASQRAQAAEPAPEPSAPEPASPAR